MKLFTPEWQPNCSPTKQHAFRTRSSNAAIGGPDAEDKNSTDTAEAITMFRVPDQLDLWRKPPASFSSSSTNIEEPMEGADATVEGGVSTDARNPETTGVSGPYQVGAMSDRLLPRGISSAMDRGEIWRKVQSRSKQGCCARRDAVATVSMCTTSAV